MKAVSAKDLIDLNKSPLDSASLYKAMYLAGLLEDIEYVSSSGTGEIKVFRSLTKDGLRFGLNKKSRYSDATEPKFYPSSFPDLLVTASKAILKHSEELAKKSAREEDDLP